MSKCNNGGTGSCCRVEEWSAGWVQGTDMLVIGLLDATMLQPRFRGMVRGNLIICHIEHECDGPSFPSRGVLVMAFLVCPGKKAHR